MGLLCRRQGQCFGLVGPGGCGEYEEGDEESFHGVEHRRLSC